MWNFCGIVFEADSVLWRDIDIDRDRSKETISLCGSHQAPASHNGSPAGRSDKPPGPPPGVSSRAIDLFDPAEIQYNLDWNRMQTAKLVNLNFQV